MKLALVCCVIFLVALASARPEGDKYTTKYDNIDLDNIIKSDRLLRSYVDCLLNRKTCTKEGEALKEILPDALKTKCEKCSEKQKSGAKKLIRFMLKERRNMWDELEAVYDPEGIYRKTYEKELKEEGIEV
ncbi:unnamed protein product [Psylliodes chrysocephalus]|uniref:Uncharacterized protein n=1 Tax=Psylliodes chrysocephalus TaxID=3402493 RepID=A0A9P0CS76_9CUCU|nr:unnamed protein product [Psylliodes chrysocephala]